MVKASQRSSTWGLDRQLSSSLNKNPTIKILSFSKMVRASQRSSTWGLDRQFSRLLNKNTSIKKISKMVKASQRKLNLQKKQVNFGPKDTKKQKTQRKLNLQKKQPNFGPAFSGKQSKPRKLCKRFPRFPGTFYVYVQREKKITFTK